MFKRKTSMTETIVLGLLLALFFSTFSRNEEREEGFGYGWIAIFTWVFAIVGVVYWKQYA
jgi:hypothetical protein